MLKLDINLLFNIINILILYLLVRKFLFKPVNKIIAQRQEEVDRKFDEADQMQKEAQAAKEECDRIEEESRAIQNDLIIDARRKASAEYDRILVDAKEEAAQILEKARKDAEKEKEEVLQKANDELKDLVINATDSLLGIRETSESDRALYDKFLSGIENDK